MSGGRAGAAVLRDRLVALHRPDGAGPRGRRAGVWRGCGMGRRRRASSPAPCTTAELVSRHAARLPSGFARQLHVGRRRGRTALTGLLLDEVGWRWLFVLYAVPGIPWAVCFARWFRNRPEQHAEVNPAELALIRGPRRRRASPPPPGEPTPWGVILTSPLLGWICGQQFFRAAGNMFYASWFATFLREHRKIDMVEAGVLNSLPLWGWWPAVWSAERRPTGCWPAPAVCGSAGRASPSSACWLRGADVPGSPDLGRVAGGARDRRRLVLRLAGRAVRYTITIDLGGRHVGPVFSVMNMAGNVGAIVFPLVVPVAAQRDGELGRGAVFCSRGCTWLRRCAGC